MVYRGLMRLVDKVQERRYPTNEKLSEKELREFESAVCQLGKLTLERVFTEIESMKEEVSTPG